MKSSKNQQKNAKSCWQFPACASQFPLRKGKLLEIMHTICAAKGSGGEAVYGYLSGGKNLPGKPSKPVGHALHAYSLTMIWPNGCTPKGPYGNMRFYEGFREGSFEVGLGKGSQKGVLRSGPAVGFYSRKGFVGKGSQNLRRGFQKVSRTPPQKVRPLRRAP